MKWKGDTQQAWVFDHGAGADEGFTSMVTATTVHIASLPQVFEQW